MLKLTPDTVAILRNFASINQSLLFSTKKQLATVAESKTILAQADILEQFPSEFGIYDLNEFLATVSLFNDPALDIADNCVKIKDDAQGMKASCKYYFADTSMIPEVPPTEKILKAISKAEISFNLTENDLNALLKAAATLQSPNLSVNSDGKKVFISTLDEKNDTSNSYSIEVGKGNGAKFKMIYKTENLKLIKGGYEVKISALKISQFKHDTLKLTYWVALEDSSSYEAK
jgi:hypothetical protein